MALDDRQRRDFEEQGYLVLERALSEELCARLRAAIGRIGRSHAPKFLNKPDIFSLDPAFLELSDHPAVLPVITELLGPNIWINTTHVNLNRPEVGDFQKFDDYGWHRDSSRIHADLAGATPRLAIKLAYYLTDLTGGSRGETYVIPGSHLTGQQLPPLDEIPEAAVPLRIPAGSVTLFDNRLVHSLTTPNLSDEPRMAVFIQYAYRWLFPVTVMTQDKLPADLSPIRQQLLGISTTYRELKSAAEGRSGRFYPADEEIPLQFYLGDGDHRPPAPLSVRVKRAIRVLLGRE